MEINSDEDASREAAIKFLTTKIKQIPEEVMVKDVEDYLIQETKKVSTCSFIYSSQYSNALSAEAIVQKLLIVIWCVHTDSDRDRY